MKKANLVLAIMLIVGVFLPISSVAAYDPDLNHEISYDFNIWAFQINSNSAPRMRTSMNIYNTWKVNLLTTTEGSGTITRFWLEDDGTKFNVSASLDVKQGSGDHYYYTQPEANNNYICLAAENNNYGNTSYYVTGYWDEETTRDWRYDF